MAERRQNEEASKKRPTEAEKVAMVEEAIRPGATPEEVAHRHGVALSSLQDWKRRVIRALQPGFRPSVHGKGMMLERYVCETPKARERLERAVSTFTHRRTTSAS